MNSVFTNEEIALIKKVGNIRHNESRKYNCNKDKYGKLKDDNYLLIDYIGCAGELALSKFLNTNWEQKVNDGKNADVLNYQVRATKYKNGKLILRDNDKLNNIYWLVYVSEDLKEYKILGWELGFSIKNNGTLENLKNNNRSLVWTLTQDKLNRPKIVNQ